MKKALLLVIAALAIPSVAMAAKPADKGGKGAPKVNYILKGALSNYTAYVPATSTTPAVNGSITIVVSGANYHGKALKGMTLTFPVDANTKISMSAGRKSITNGDKGIVKVRAAKKIAAADLAATLQLLPAKQIVDQGAGNGKSHEPKPPKH